MIKITIERTSKKKKKEIKKIFHWNLDKIDKKKIYAYYEPQYGGIYKTIQYQEERGEYKYGFIRIDNNIGYCQHKYESLKELFIKHYRSNHKEYIIYEFNSTKDFLEWSLMNEELN